MPPGNVFPQPNARAKIQAHFQQAEQDFRAKRFGDAQREFMDILRLDPNNAIAYYDLGGIAFQEGQCEKAARDFRNAFQFDASLRKAQALLGICELRLGQVEGAREDLADSLPGIPESPLRKQVLEDLVQIYYNDQTLNKIVDILRTNGDADSKDPELLYDTYRVYTQLASHALSSLAQVAPRSPRLQQILAESLMTRGDSRGAIAEYKKALAENPRLSGLHFELGQAILAKSQDPAARVAAKKEFQAELSIDPSNPYAEYGLGEIFWLDSNPKAALEHFSRAIRLSPGFADAQIGLGKVWMELGAIDKALAHFSAAARLEPQNPQVHYQLALAYRKLNRPQEADREIAAFEKLQKEENSSFPAVSGQLRNSH
jgi:tetratricopeptide (TPR) repeat protein